MTRHRAWRLTMALSLLSWLALPLTAQAAQAPGGGSLYSSTPILADNFSSGSLSPFVANDGLSPGGTWQIANNSLVATDYGSGSPLPNQIAAVPNMPENVVLDTTFTINQVNAQQYYRIGLFGRGSAPGTGISQWDLVLDHGTLSMINQNVNYPGSVPYSVSAGQSYHMMMVIAGNWVGGKIWPVGSSEPSQWMVSSQFIPTGNLTSVGLAAGNADVTFHSFDVYPAPPGLTVTPTQPGAVFSGHGPATYTADLQASSSNQGGQYYVNYLVTGLNGSTISQGQVPIQLPDGGSAQASIVLPLQQYGYYHTTFSLTNQQSTLRYTPQFPTSPQPPTKSGHMPTPPSGPASQNQAGSGKNGLTPPPGHTLNLLPSAPGQLAVPAADLAASTTTAPVENTTASMAMVSANAALGTLDSSSPFGVNGPGNRFGPITSSLESQFTTADTLFKKQGIEWARTEFMWNNIEPKPGVYTWNTSDGLVTAAHTTHMNLLGLLDYWGNYANPFSVNGGPQVSFSTFLQEYDQYIQSVVQRYMPGGTLAKQMGWQHYGITAWEIWNEPSTPQFWPSQNPTQYAELVKSASAAIKAVDPSATILAYTWHPNTLVSVAGTNSFTGLSIHYYSYPAPPGEAYYYGGVQSLRQFLTQNNIGSDPIWMTESGWSTNSATQVQQAQYLVRAEIQSLAGSLNKFFMFSWYYPGTIPGGGYGELTGTMNALQPKVSYAALAGLAKELTGYTSAGSVNPINMGSAIRAFAFQNGQSSLVAVWSPNDSGSLTLTHPDNVQAYDWMGNPIALTGGNLTVPLGGSPVYLVANMPPAQLAQAVQQGTVTGIAPVSISIQNLNHLPNTLPNLHLSITNQINKPQSGTVTVNLPAGWQASPNSTTAATYTPSLTFGPLAPSATVSPLLTLSRFEANTTNQYSVQATATLNESGTGTHTSAGPPSSGQTAPTTVSASVPISVFQSVYGTPPLTGTFQNWGNASPVYLNRPSQNMGITNWNPAAESTIGYTMWNKQYFYFAAKVKDPVFYQPYTGWMIWAGDSIQMYWDPQNLKTTGFVYANGDTDMGLALTPAGPQAFRWSGPGYGLHPDVKLTIVHGKNAGDLWYEAAIPMSDLPYFSATNGHQYGFDFLVNYNNGGGRIGWMWLAPGIGNAWDPADFPTFTLVNSAGLAAVRLDTGTPQGQVSFTPNQQGAVLTVTNTGLGAIKITLSSGTILSLVAQSGAATSVTPKGANPTVPILANGTTSINLANYVTPSANMTLTASAVPTSGTSAVIAVDNGVQP